jgi:hypothetical protein
MRGDVALGAETKRPPLDAALQFSYLNLIEFPSRNGTFNQFGRLESKRKEEKERVCSGKERQAAECFFPAAEAAKSAGGRFVGPSRCVCLFFRSPYSLGSQCHRAYTAPITGQ